MSGEDEVPPGSDDVWTDEFDDPDLDPDEDEGFAGLFERRSSDPFADEFGDDPSARRGRGRLLLGAGLVLVGLLVAVTALLQGGDDDGAAPATGTAVKAATTDAEATTTTEDVPATVVPTTLAGGALPTGCGNWDDAFGFEPDDVRGVAIYSDFSGWHIRLAPDGPSVVTGTVVGQVTPLVSTDPPGPGVQLIADPATSTVTFKLTAGEEPVGFDFGADCAQKQLTFDLKLDDGTAVDPAEIHLGRAGGVTSLPVVAQRSATSG